MVLDGNPIASLFITATFLFVQISAFVLIALIDIRTHLINRRLLGVIVVSTLIQVLLWQCLLQCVCVATISWGLYFLGKCWGRVGGGDVKLAPCVASQIITWRHVWLVDYSPQLMTEGTLTTVLSLVVLTVIWIVGAQFITLCAIGTRYWYARIDIRTRIAHAPAMIGSCFIICALQTWFQF